MRPFALPLAVLLSSLAMPSLADTAADILPDPERVLGPGLDFDARHEACLEAIAVDPESAFETALTWVGRGGGHRARHCEAMALFALGQEKEAGARLDDLATRLPTQAGGTVDRWRTDYRAAAAQSWLQSGEYDAAYMSATAALEITPADADARITRARVYFALDRVSDADVDLTTLLVFHPDHAEGLRYRADARLRQGRLDDALRDISDSLSLETSVDSALVRGHILEAIRERDALASTSTAQDTP